MKKGYLLVLMLIAGCGKPSDTKNVTVVDQPTTNFAAQMLALPQQSREIALFRAIRDAGLPCQSVTGAQLINTNPARPEWRARCDNGTYHLITVDPNGIALVVSRTER